ncbi:MAG: TolC family protein [Bacteroidetes bacterium]|nr:TolC family protein [Bacteroidota bacterium]
MRTIISLFLICLQTLVQAQDSTILKAFLLGLNDNHPMLKSANITLEQYQLKLLQARGGFDPKIELLHQQKEFNGTEYYNQNKAEIKIPTWYGIELKGGYELNTGQYLNNENTTGLDGLSYAEISIPILQNLLLDQRRASLTTAQFELAMGAADRQAQLNDLYLLVSLAYWDWYESTSLQNLYADAVKVADTRLQAIKRTVALGSYALIDTVEAFMELSRRQAVLQEFNARQIGAFNQLMNHAWSTDSNSLSYSNPSFQLLFTTDKLLQMVDSFVLENHPSIVKIDQKLLSNSVEQNLYKQQYLPDVRLSYKPLVSGTSMANYSTENYTIGASAQVPLFFRKERAKYQLTVAKGEQINQDLRLKQRTLINDLNTYTQSLQMLTEMLAYQQNMVNAANRMLVAERRRLELGDATIFMINYRERYLLEAQMKLIKTQKDLAKTQSVLLHKLGLDVLELLKNT